MANRRFEMFQFQYRQILTPNAVGRQSDRQIAKAKLIGRRKTAQLTPVQIVARRSRKSNLVRLGVARAALLNSNGHHHRPANSPYHPH